MRLPIPLATVLIAVFIAGCDDSGSDDPSPAELYGIWVADFSDTEVLVIEMAETNNDHTDLEGHSPVYIVSRYEPGSTRYMTQRGTYTVHDHHWVTTVTWDESGSSIGNTYGNEIYDFTGDTWALESTTDPSGRRTFTRQESYP